MTRKVFSSLEWQEILKRQSQNPTMLTQVIPSILETVSDDITSASVLLCDTAVCLLHVHEIGTHA